MEKVYHSVDALVYTLRYFICAHVPLRSGLPPSQRHSVLLKWMVARVVSLCTHKNMRTRTHIFLCIYLSLCHTYIYIYMERQKDRYR